MMRSSASRGRAAGDERAGAERAVRAEPAKTASSSAILSAPAVKSVIVSTLPLRERGGEREGVGAAKADEAVGAAPAVEDVGAGIAVDRSWRIRCRSG